MPSKRRKKTRRKIKIVPLLAWLLTLNVAAGLWFSPATAVHRVRVLDAKGWDQARLRTELQRLKDTPYFRLKQTPIESRIASPPAVDSAVLTRNIFGRAVLQMVYRKPVAKVVVRQNVALSDSGVAFATPDDLSGLPLVQFPNTVLKPWLAAGNAVEATKVAWLCGQTSRLAGMDLKVVVVNSQGAVSLRDGTGAMVKLGPAEKLEDKLLKLEAILQRRPGILENVLELNLFSPTHPVMVEKRKLVQP